MTVPTVTDMHIGILALLFACRKIQGKTLFHQNQLLKRQSSKKDCGASLCFNWRMNHAVLPSTNIIACFSYQGLGKNRLPPRTFQILGNDASRHLRLTVPLNRGRNKIQVLQLQNISGKVHLN